jgi:hypothetical protein
MIISSRQALPAITSFKARCAVISFVIDAGGICSSGFLVKTIVPVAASITTAA